MSPKIAVIGLGVMGNNHARVLKELGVLSLVCDTNREVAAKKGTQYGVPFCSSIEGVINWRPDAVVIAAPTPLHHEIGTACLRAGIDVFMEKPLAHSIEAAAALVEAANQSGRIFTVGYIERFNPAVRALQSLLEPLSHGQLHLVCLVYSNRSSNYY